MFSVRRSPRVQTHLANLLRNNRLINLALAPPGVKFKKSAMPFVQMENVSHFLRACKSPPLNLQEHDVFLTVDLYESKDPAQVLQCLSAFSRAANRAKPSVFPTAIGARTAAALSPQRTGAYTISPTPTPGLRPRGLSNSSNTSSAYGRPAMLSASKTGDSGRWSPNKSPGGGPKSPSVSSWSSRAHEGSTSPAWNIAQYGYMGGASQGNLGISFGGRRQITNAGPAVPSLAEKEKRLKNKVADEQRQRDEDEARRRARVEADEERARLDEERRWEVETRRQREDEARRVAEEKRRWEEEERQWKITEEKRRREEDLAEKRLAQERAKVRSRSNSRLQGQYLSQYQAENASDPSQRIKELEEQLERARQREAEYENERQTRGGLGGDAKARARSRSRVRDASGTPSRQDSWARGDDSDGEGLRASRNKGRPVAPPRQNSRLLPDPSATGLAPPAKVQSYTSQAAPLKAQHTGGSSSRPLPDPRAYTSPVSSPTINRNSEQFFTPPTRQPQQRSTPKSIGSSGGGGRASKSLLEREMEMERQRQREWEEAQKETANATRSPHGGVDGIGGGVGGRWDVSQFAGYTGGDSMNRGTQGIGAGRRQIVGPRPLPGTPGPR